MACGCARIAVSRVDGLGFVVDLRGLDTDGHLWAYWGRWESEWSIG